MCTVSSVPTSSSLCMVTSRTLLEFFAPFQMRACSRRSQSSTTTTGLAWPPVPPPQMLRIWDKADLGPSA